MFYKSRILFILVIAFFLSSLDIKTPSNPGHNLLTSNSDADPPQSPYWIDPRRTYFSHYMSPADKRPNGTCWQAPVIAPKIAIVAIFKNEAQGMLDHYMWQGLDAVLLLDNGSTDDWKPIVQKYN